MIANIIEFSIRNRFIVILVTLGVVAWGVHAVINTPVDAIPDLSENQVIVFTDWMGRSPQEIEDQVTYPLSVNLQGLAGVKAVRSSSEFNFSMINVIFDDNVDFYFARQRVLERLTLSSTFLPQGVTPYLAPDATALGQIFWYTVEGQGQDLGRLRAIQDWYVRYAAQLGPRRGPGGLGRRTADRVPDRRRSPQAPRLQRDPRRALFRRLAGQFVGRRQGHREGQRRVHRPRRGLDREHRRYREDRRQDRGREGHADLRRATRHASSRGGEFRRSVLEKNGSEAVGAVVMMRQGENPLQLTRRIKAKIEELQPGLPEGVRVVPFYDRTRLINGAIETVTETLRDEMIIASLAILLILMHFRSAVLICMTLPLAVLVSFILMKQFHVSSNIMSLSGIAISIGILVDQSIVMVENATHHLTAHFGPGKRIEGDTREIVIRACRTVGRPIFFSVMIILLSFIPVFALTGPRRQDVPPAGLHQEFCHDRRGRDLDYAVPALIPSFIKGRLRSENESWLVRNLIGIYKPWLTWLMPRRNFAMWSFSALLIVGAGLFPLEAVIGLPYKICFLFIVAVTMLITILLIVGWRWQLLSFVTLGALALTAYNFPKIGTDYMPPLDEGSILDMPVTVPRVSVAQAAADLKTRDAIIRQFPEVELIVGKAGRADTPTDPSPLDMVESVITLRPERALAQAEARLQRRPDADGRRARCLAETEPHRAASRSIATARPDGPGHDERRDAVRRGDAGDGAGAVHRSSTPNSVPNCCGSSSRN